MAPLNSVWRGRSDPLHHYVAKPGASVRAAIRERVTGLGFR
jgi:hypothetical protein